MVVNDRWGSDCSCTHGGYFTCRNWRKDSEKKLSLIRAIPYVSIILLYHFSVTYIPCAKLGRE